MSEYLPAFLVIAIGIGLIQLARLEKRLQDAEAMLRALTRHFGIEHRVIGGEHGVFVEPSDRVKELARDPKAKIEAIKAYREQTGLGLKEAKKVVDSLSQA
jgi:ribosomal protein L7/L12